MTWIKCIEKMPEPNKRAITSSSKFFKLSTSLEALEADKGVTHESK